MFYNLKIYSKDCEFSLDSKDRDIIQREMDLYFSVFFGASVDFNSKIKKIDVSCPAKNLKSIEEVDVVANKKADNAISSDDIEEINDIKDVVLASNPETLNENVPEKEIDKEDEKEENSISISKEEISKIEAKIDDFLFSNDEFPQKEIQITNVPNVQNIKNSNDEIKIASKEETKPNEAISQKPTEPILIKNEPEIKVEPLEQKEKPKEDKKPILTQEERKELEEILFSNESSYDLDGAPDSIDDIEEIEENNNSIQDILSQAKSKLNSLNISSDEDRFENVSNLEKLSNIKKEEPKDEVTFRAKTNVDEVFKNEVQKNSWAEEFEKKDDKENLKKTQSISQEPVDLPQDLNFDEPKEKNDIEPKMPRKESSVEVLYDRDAIEKSNQSKLDNIFDFKGTTFGDNSSSKASSKEEIEPTTPVFEKSFNEEDFVTQILSETPTKAFVFEEIKDDKTPYEIPSENLYAITSEKTEAPSATPREINLEENVEKNSNKEAKEENIEAQAPKKEILKKDVHDFNDFLSNFEHSKIADEFLICAYYVKNISQNESFTMKGINAKIFRATGKIAGMSILNELIEKKLIALVEDLDIKKYSITDLGEEYFMNNFQK